VFCRALVLATLGQASSGVGLGCGWGSGEISAVELWSDVGKLVPWRESRPSVMKNSSRHSRSPVEFFPSCPATRLYHRLVEIMRVWHYSIRTGEAYVYWILRFILFRALEHLRELRQGDRNCSLTNLPVQADTVLRRGTVNKRWRPALCSAMMLVIGSLGSVTGASMATARADTATPDETLLGVIIQHQKDLNLTTSQFQTLERVRTAFLKDSIKTQADLRIAEIELAELQRSDLADLAKTEAKLAQIASLRTAITLQSIRAADKVKATLTPDQRKKLEAWVPSSRFLSALSTRVNQTYPAGSWPV
jgi:Spy/CpxP family protein refolding chaperone